MSDSDQSHANPEPTLKLSEPLTDRELEVLRLIGEGYRNREIADRLVIGVSTVKKHINRIFSKLGVDSRARAIIRAQQLNLLTPSPFQIVEGAIIKGYTLQKCIGSGSFGLVFKANQPLVEREIAIKAIRPEFANQPEFVRRFEIEVQLVAQLEHPNIVPLYDYWREPGGAFLVMRLLAFSLGDRLKQGPLTIPEATRLIEQIAGALDMAHRNGVVHRDLKPANILLDDDGNAYLADFGVAKVLGSVAKTTQNGVIIGSPAYLSPEQIKSEAITPCADIYSLGVLIHEVLTGRSPFPADLSPSALLYKQLNEPLPSLLDVNPDLPSALDNVLAKATAKDPAQRYQNALELVHAIHAAVGRFIPHVAHSANDTLPSVTDEDLTWTPVHNPYKGLKPFTEADADDFFGRETLVETLVSCLEAEHPYAHFLAIIGPSGSGKSSVARAGLIKALRDGALPESERWFYVQMQPGTRPLDELEVQLLRVAVYQPPGLMHQLTRDAYGLTRASRLILPDDGELFLLIDQFEELFLLADNPDHTQHMLDLIVAAVTDPRSQVRVVVTLRADFYDHPLLHPGFGELLRHRTEVVLPLNAEELEQAITRPAERVGVQVDSALSAAIVAEVSQQPGGLPMLQYALTEMFDQSKNHALTLETYHKHGGVLGVLAKQAEAVYCRLDPQQRTIARQLFFRLVTIGEGTENTRRRVRQLELLSLGSGITAAVLDAFDRARLLTLDHDPASREPTVEVAHEALFREWSRLREWLDNDRHDVLQQRLLAVAAKSWITNLRDASYLLHGARLRQFEDWSASTNVVLTQDEQDYLDVSITERDFQAEIERERQTRETALRRLVQRTFQLIAIICLIAAVVGVGLAIFAFNQRDNAQEAQTKAKDEATLNRSLRLAGSAEDEFEAGRMDLALALALAATDIEDPPAEAIQTLRTVALGPGTRAVLQEHGNAIRTIAFSPDGEQAISGSCVQLGADGECIKGELIVWDVENRAELYRLEGHTGWVNGVAFSPDGLTALSGASDGTPILWNLDANSRSHAIGEIVRRFEGHTSGVNSVAISPDGLIALSGSEDNSLIVWDITTGKPIRTLDGHTDAVNIVVFRPTQDEDGPLMALSGSDDSTLILWDVYTGKIIHRFVQSGEIHVAMFTSDGNTIISGGSETTLYKWDANTGEELARVITGLNTAFAAVTPDGRSVLAGTGSMDMLWLWNVATLSWEADLVPPARPISIAISPDGRTVLSGSENGHLSLLNFAVSLELRHFATDGIPQGALAITQDGRRILTTDPQTCGAILWDVETGKPIRQLRHEIKDDHGTDLVATDIAFHPDGRRALLNCSNWLGNTDKVWLSVWDTDTGIVLHELQGHQFNIRTITISPDGHLALTGSHSWVGDDTEKDLGELMLWDLETGQLIRQFDHEKSVTGVDFSADGQRAISSSNGAQNVIVWNVNTGEQIYHIDNIGGVGDVIFGPDDTTALTAMTNTYLILWDLETGSILRRFVGHETWGYQLELSPDGRYVMSRDFVGEFILWDFRTGGILRRLGFHRGITKNFAFSPTGQTAFVSRMDGNIIELQIAGWPLDKLLVWIKDNRYLRDFTCDERIQFRIEPLCQSGDK